MQKADARDKRPESHRLIETSSAEKIAEALSTKNNWAERLKYLLPTSFPNIAALQSQLYDQTNDTWGQSLAPIQVRAGSAVVTFENDNDDWNEKESQKLEKAKQALENSLFTTPEQIKAFKTLQKLPYKVRLSFEDLTGTRHAFLVTDWEIGRLFLKERMRVGEAQALENVKRKIESEIFAASNDVYLILGSVFGHLKTTTLVVVGFVYPKTAMPQLSMDSLFS